jgi:hypothetical protein
VPNDWGTTAFVKLVAGDAVDFAAKMRVEFETSVVPGHYFDMQQYFRIGMGVNSEMFPEGIRPLGLALA